MMRYGHKVPGSLGFVIAQDGEVRAMTRVGEYLIVWDNLKSQAHTFAPVPRQTSSRKPPSRG